MTAPFQLLPDLPPEQYANLRADIEANGVRVPIDVDEHDEILDGHNRAAIAADLGVPCPRRTVSGLDDTGKRSHALAVNVQRRVLSREQTRALVATSVRADPQLSDREHARRCGVDHKTVATVRADLETGGEIPHLEARQNPQGRPQPATKQRAPDPDLIAEAVAEFPDLAYYADAGRDDDVRRLASALRAYDEPERTQRVDILRKTIAAEQRRAAEPATDSGPDYLKLADRIFTACNGASQQIKQNGGADTIAAALDSTVHQVQVDNWHGQFTDLARLCDHLAKACRPNLRSVK